MMKAHSKTSKQSGFFDLGLSMVILALAGGTVLLVETEQQEKIDITANQQAATAEIVLVETTDSASAVR